MAVVIKAANAIAAMQQLGVDFSYVDTMKQPGYHAKLTASKFELWYQAENGPHVILTDKLEVPVTLDQLQKLKAGTIPNTEKKKLRDAVMSAILQLTKLVQEAKKPGQMDALQAAANKLGTPEPITDTPAFAKLKKAVAEANLPEPSDKFAMEPVDKAPSSQWGEFKGNLQTAELIPLRQATKLYQPVKGTSEGSRYFMVAGSEDLRVAVRWHAGSLSIRAEGPGFSKWAVGLTALGFKNNKDYASVHLTPGNVLMARKTLGALLLGMGIPMKTQFPDMKKVIG
jgi:hypothetical protein